MKSMRLLVLPFVTCVALSGFTCSDPATPCACTEEFRTYTVRVIDAASQPVSDVTITRVNLRTDEILQPGWLGMLEPGYYLVADDGMLDLFSSDGDTVRVSGAKDGVTFVADFVFATPEPCRCHVVKLAGPDLAIMGEVPPR